MVGETNLPGIRDLVDKPKHCVSRTRLSVSRPKRINFTIERGVTVEVVVLCAVVIGGADGPLEVTSISGKKADSDL